jgi:transposase
MSVPTIASYFPFRRIKIVDQIVSPDASTASIWVTPHQSYHPLCHGCGGKATGVHSWTERTVRDLSMTSARLWITCRYRKVYCVRCRGIHIEDLQLFHPYLRVTHRMALYVHELCQFMTVSEVARHLGMNWKTVKEIDKYFLERDYGQPDLNRLRILAVDEIAVRKGHRYLTVVLDYITGRVVYVGKDRKARTLERFFNQLSPQQRKAIEAVAMDMWDPFIKAVKKNCLRRKLSLTCSMWWPTSTGLSIKSESPNTALLLLKIRRSLKVPNICC